MDSGVGGWGAWPGAEEAPYTADYFQRRAEPWWKQHEKEIKDSPSHLTSVHISLFSTLVDLFPGYLCFERCYSPPACFLLPSG